MSPRDALAAAPVACRSKRAVLQDRSAAGAAMRYKVK